MWFAIIDLYSRKLIAWEVHPCENGELAADLIERARWREHLIGRKHPPNPTLKSP